MKGIIYSGAIAVIFVLALGDAFATKPSDEFQSNGLVLAGDAASIDRGYGYKEIEAEREACKDYMSTKKCKNLKKKGKCDSEAAEKNCKKTCGHCDDKEEQECCCEAALYKFSYPGVVPFGKGDVVWTTNFWARQFKIDFDIQVTEELPATSPDPTNPVAADYYNVFHMTIGQNYDVYGDRYPALWVQKEKFFAIGSAVSGDINYVTEFNYNLNQWYHIEILQKGNANGEIIYSVEIDGFTVDQVVNTLPQRFEKVILYTSDPFYPSFAPFGEVKNLNIANLDKFPA